MNRVVKRLVAGAVGVLGGVGLMAGSALADDCINASKKDQSAGAQIIFGPDDEVVFMTNGLRNRIEQGLIDPDTGEGFHGLLAFDFDGDGVADGSTWFGVGPDGEEIPEQAQFHGPACRGLTNLGIYFTECAGA